MPVDLKPHCSTCLPVWVHIFHEDDIKAKAAKPVRSLWPPEIAGACDRRWLRAPTVKTREPLRATTDPLPLTGPAAAVRTSELPSHGPGVPEIRIPDLQ